MKKCSCDEFINTIKILKSGQKPNTSINNDYGLNKKPTKINISHKGRNRND